MEHTLLEDLEEEMRQALFGGPSANPISTGAGLPSTDAQFSAPPRVKRTISRTFAPKLRVVLRVGNEFEGKTYEFVHEVSTLSTLLAEQEAVKAARRKYRFVEVVSVGPK